MGDVTRSRRSSGQTSDHERGTFAAALMGLKRRGCCILVTGQVSERVRAAQSSLLFGDSDTFRQRVLALTDATPELTTQYLPTGITSAHPSVSTLDYTDVVRDITSTVSPPLQSLPSTDRVDRSPSATGLGTLLCGPIDAAIDDDLCPGALRIGIATLGVILDTDGLSATRSFVRTVRQHVMAACGMGHFHLPGSPGPETFTVLFPLVDIHIELRESNRVPEHRWHLLGTDHSTEWLPM